MNAFKKNKTIQNETEFIRMNEGIENRNNEPNIMNDYADIGNLALNDAAASYIKELFTPSKSWYEEDFFQPKDTPLERGQLKITSTINDITIFIDDEYVGLTPLSENIELTVGSHKVWCIPPVPINNSRWYENPISENVIGDVIHNVFIEANEVTTVDFDLYILNTSPNYKEKTIYQDSLGVILGLNESRASENKEMKRFLNKRIKSLKSSSSKKTSSRAVEFSAEKKNKELLNGPPPTITSTINKRKKNQLVPKLVQKSSDESATIITDSDEVLNDGLTDRNLINDSNDIKTDTSKNLFNRLLSTFKNTDREKRVNNKDSTVDLYSDVTNQQNQIKDSMEFEKVDTEAVKKPKSKSIKELFSNSLSNEDNAGVSDIVESNKNDIENKKIPKSKRKKNIKRLFSSSKSQISNTQKNNFIPRNRRGSKLDVVRIVNAEYVNPKKRLPDNINFEFPSSNHRVYCFTVVKNLNNPVNISHYWYRNGSFMARVPMEIGYSSSWRCWSYITLRDGFEGDWRVVVRGPNNEELDEISFTIYPNRNLAKQKR